MDLAETIDEARRRTDEGALDEALALLLEAAQTHTDEGLDLEIATLYTERGLRRPDEEEALSDFNEALTWAELPITLAAVASLRIRREEYAEAETLLSRALDADPEMPEAVVALARLRLAQGKVQEAGDRLSAAVQADPRNGVAWLLLAEALEKTGRSDDARAALREGARQAMDDRLLLALARSYVAARDPRAALGPLRTVLSHHPDDAEAWRELALAAGLVGDELEMHRAYEHACRLDPQGSAAWLSTAKSQAPALSALE